MRFYLDILNADQNDKKQNMRKKKERRIEILVFGESSCQAKSMPNNSKMVKVTTWRSIVKSPKKGFLPHGCKNFGKHVYVVDR